MTAPSIPVSTRRTHPARAWLAPALFTLTTLGALAAAAPAHAATPDATARFLAGMAPDEVFGDDSRARTVRDFAKAADKSWQTYWKRIGAPMTAWAEQELAQEPGETIFYPFSGPDLPTAVQLYPDAGRYVLVALQTGGRVPDLDALQGRSFTSYVSIFRRGWVDYARRGFFRTDDLKADTGEDGTLEGVTPLLMAFAARLGFTVNAVEPIRVNADGTGLEAHPGPRDEVATWDSVRLDLERDGRRLTVDYVHLDLSDGHLKKADTARAWLETVSKHKVFTKAASHLMQKPFFSIVRDTLLAHAPSIVQDETGIDYKDLVQDFDVQLYGRFSRAHRLWTAGVQRELADAYRKRKDVKPLKFKYGYHKDQGYCVQVATRR